MLLPNWQPNHWIYVSFLNTLRLWQSCCHFTDNIFKCIFLNENVWIWIKISIKLIPGGPVSNIPTLVQIMAWCRSGTKPLSELMMVSLLKHICSTWPQWVKQQLPALHNEPQMCEKVKKFIAFWPNWAWKSCWPWTIFCCPGQSGFWSCWALAYHLATVWYILLKFWHKSSGIILMV